MNNTFTFTSEQPEEFSFFKKVTLNYNADAYDAFKDADLEKLLDDSALGSDDEEEYDMVQEDEFYQEFEIDSQN